MYDMARDYKAAQEERDSKRDGEMKARLEAKFTEMKEFSEKLEADRADRTAKERAASRWGG